MKIKNKKNKIYALILFIIGLITLPILHEATVFIFLLILSAGLFFAKDNWIY